VAGRRRRRSGSSLGRFLAVAAFLPIASRSPVYARLMRVLIQDDRVATSRKAVLGGALAYVIMPFDIIPDDIPLAGVFDDLIVVVLAIDIFFEGVPEDVLVERLAEVGIERDTFDRDLGQLRRLTPRPVRRLAGQVADGVGLVVAAARTSGIGPRVRAWINREGSFA